MDGDALIGRDMELARVRAYLDADFSESVRCVFLVGEAGVGKTRLAREVLDAARAMGWRTLVGRCFEQHTGLPLFPFTELLAQAWETAPDSVREQAPQRWPDLGRIVSDLVPNASQNADDAQQRACRAVTEFLRACAYERPVILFLDDLHWADSASLDLVLYLGRHLLDGRVFVLGSYRDVDVSPQHPLESVLRELVRERVLDEVTVRRLPAEGTDALVHSRLGAPVLSSDFVEMVHARTEGNPLFIEEILKSVVENGTLVRVSEGWQYQTGDIQIPRSLRSVVAQRVERLPIGARDVLQLACVLGQEFDLDVLLAASSQPELDVLDHIDAALTARLLVERRGGRAERYAFAHALIAQTLYEAIPAHRVHRLHRRVGQALESIRGMQPAAAAELARHFLLAAQEEPAARYALQAATHAAQLYAHAEAVQYYQMALELAREEADATGVAEIQRKLAAEFTELNQPTQALACLEVALALYRKMADTLAEAEVHREIAWVYQAHQTFNVRAAMPHLDAALRLWPKDRRDTALAQLLLDCVRAKVFSSLPTEAAELAARGLALAEELGDPALLARALIEGALVNCEQGPAGGAVDELDRAERLALTAAPKLLHRLYWNRGLARHRLGNLELALVDYQRGIESARAVQQAGTVAWQSAVHASMLVYQAGDWPAARIAAHEALAADPRQTMHAEVIAWADGEHERALELMRASAEDARRRDHAPGLIDALGTLANALVQLDRLTEAESAAREAIDLVRGIGQWGMATDAYAPACEILVRVGAPDAVEVLQEAEGLAERLGQHIAWPALLRARAVLARRDGQLATAAQDLQSSAALARTQGARIQLGRTLAVLSEVARAQGDLDLQVAVNAERTALIERIGPHVELLPWAAGALAPRVERARREPGSDGLLAVLTRRELQVAALVADGLTDRQIAEALIITEGTAGIHVGHILNKLGFRSRAQVAVWAAEHDLIKGRQIQSLRESRISKAHESNADRSH